MGEFYPEIHLHIFAMFLKKNINTDRVETVNKIKVISEPN